jgi:hypothetical protein
MRFLMRLALVVLIVAGVFWLVRGGTLREAGRDVGKEVGAAADKARDAIADADVEAIKDELARTGRVVRRKASGAAIAVADATRDARTTAAIKTKLALDAQLSPLDISVDTTNGLVTLAGRADSPEAVARAMQVALEQEGVSEVVSTLQVSQKRPG